MLFRLSGEKSCLFTTSVYTGHKKVYVEYGSWSSWRHESLGHSSVLALKVEDFS